MKLQIFHVHQLGVSSIRVSFAVESSPPTRQNNHNHAEGKLRRFAVFAPTPFTHANVSSESSGAPFFDDGDDISEDYRRLTLIDNGDSQWTASTITLLALLGMDAVLIGAKKFLLFVIFCDEMKIVGAILG